MQLNLNRLRRKIKRAVDEEKNVESFRSEVTKVFGPIIDVNVRLEELAKNVNDRILVLERTGRDSNFKFNSSLLFQFHKNSDPEVRKLCAKLLPEHLARKLINDRNFGVRAILASRLSLSEAKKLVRRNINDYESRRILKERQEKEKTTRLGDAVKQNNSLELSDVWYETQAYRFLQDYGQLNHDEAGRALDFNWEESVVSSFCRHTKATSGVEIDHDKLFKALRDIITAREDKVLKNEGKISLKALAQSLRDEHKQDLINETKIMPCISESTDPIQELLENYYESGSIDFDSINSLFKIKFAKIPVELGKYKLGESIDKTGYTKVPMKGQLPNCRNFCESSEKVLDLYVESWNRRKKLSGEPVRLTWEVDPCKLGSFGFSATLK